MWWEHLELGYGQVQPRTGERQRAVYECEYLSNWSPVVLCNLSSLGTANSQPPVGLGPKSVILKELVLLLLIKSHPHT